MVEEMVRVERFSEILAVMEEFQRVNLNEYEL